MSLFLGIDGGGTQTRAVIVDDAGRVLGRGTAGASNYHSVGVDGACAAVVAAQSDALSRASLSPETNFDAACLGLAGCGSAEDQQNLMPLAAALNVASPDAVRIESDMRIAHAGAFAGKAGIVLIAGTGSSCLGVDEQNNLARAGGWGPMFDDRGSGFDLGRMAIRHALAAADGREASSEFSRRVTQELGGNLRAIARMSAVGEDRARIAALAPLIFQAAEHQDSTIAKAIVQHAARDLAQMVQAVKTQLNFSTHPVEVVLLGGLMRCDFFLRELSASIRAAIPTAVIVDAHLSALLGAALLAMKHIGRAVTDEHITQMK